MIEWIVAIMLGVLFGLLGARVTRDEKGIYLKSPYFPVMVWVIAVLAAVFLTLDKVVGLSLVFMFVMVLVWWRF